MSDLDARVNDAVANLLAMAIRVNCQMPEGSRGRSLAWRVESAAFQAF